MKGLGRADRAPKIALVLRNAVRPRNLRQQTAHRRRAAFLSLCRSRQDVLRSGGVQPQCAPYSREVQNVAAGPHSMRHQQVAGQLVDSVKL